MAFEHDHDLLTTGAAAQLLAVSQDTVARWVRRGKLPNQPTEKGHARIPRAAVLALRDGRPMQHTDEHPAVPSVERAA